MLDIVVNNLYIDAANIFISQFNFNTTTLRTVYAVRKKYYRFNYQSNRKVTQANVKMINDAFKQIQQ